MLTPALFPFQEQDPAPGDRELGGLLRDPFRVLSAQHIKIGY